MASEVSRLWRAFRAYDSSGDGYIQRKELIAATKKGLAFSKDEAELLFEAADVNGDGRLDFGEFFKVMTGQSLDPRYSRELLEAFRELDLDNDGMVTKKELQKARKAALNATQARVLDALLREADVDGDERISLEEFCSMISPSMLHEMSAARLGADRSIVALFAMLDVDGDGYITQRELASVASRFNVTSDDVEGIFEAADADGDKRIDFAEFVDLNKRIPLTDFFSMMTAGGGAPAST